MNGHRAPELDIERESAMREKNVKPGEPLVMVVGVVSIAVMTEKGTFVDGFLKGEGPMAFESKEIDLPGHGKHPIRWTTIGEFQRMTQPAEA